MSGPPRARRERAGTGPGGPAGRHPGSRSTWGDTDGDPGPHTGPAPKFDGPSAGFHCWVGIDPHCTRCELLFDVWANGGSPANCPAATVLEELTAAYGPPDEGTGQVQARRPAGVTQSWYWSSTLQYGRVYLSVQWTGEGGCWEVVAGRDPKGYREGRQVQFSYGDNPAAAPSQALIRMACVLAGLLDA